MSEFPSASLVAQLVKNLPAKQETLGSIPGLGRSPGRVTGYPFQYSCLETPTERSLVGYSLLGHTELNTTEWLSLVPLSLAQGLVHLRCTIKCLPPPPPKKRDKRCYLWKLTAQQHHQGEFELKHASRHVLQPGLKATANTHSSRVHVTAAQMPLQTTSTLCPPYLMLPLNLPSTGLLQLPLTEHLAGHTVRRSHSLMLSQPKDKSWPLSITGWPASVAPWAITGQETRPPWCK